LPSSTHKAQLRLPAAGCLFPSVSTVPPPHSRRLLTPHPTAPTPTQRVSRTLSPQLHSHLLRFIDQPSTRESQERIDSGARASRFAPKFKKSLEPFLLFLFLVPHFALWQHCAAAEALFAIPSLSHTHQPTTPLFGLVRFPFSLLLICPFYSFFWL